MSFAVSTDDAFTTVRSDAFDAHSRIVVGTFVIITVIVVAVLPSAHLPQLLAIVLLLPALWGWWYARGSDLALDQDGLSEMVRRAQGVRLRWDEISGFSVETLVPPRQLRWLGRGDDGLAWVVTVRRVDGDAVALWGVGQYGSAPPRDDTARVATSSAADGEASARELAEFLEQRRVEALGGGASIDG